MKKILAVLIMLLLISVTGCSSLTDEQDEAIEDIKTQTENMTVGEFFTAVENMTMGELAEMAENLLGENEKETGNESVPQLIGETVAEPDPNSYEVIYPWVKKVSFNGGELVLVENTPEELVFRVDYFQDGEPVKFRVGEKTRVALFIFESSFEPDFSTTGAFDEQVELLKKIYYYTNNDDLLTVNKAEIATTKASELTVLFNITPYEFGGNDFGEDSGRDLNLSSWVWMTIKKDW